MEKKNKRITEQNEKKTLNSTSKMSLSGIWKWHRI